MVNPANSGGGKSWRRAKGPASGRTPAAKRSIWAQKPDRTYEHAKQRYRAKVAAWALSFVVLLVGFIVYVFLMPKVTPFLVTAVTGYEAPLPPNAFAKEDSQRLMTLDKEQILIGTPVDWQSKTLGMRLLRDKLDSAIPGGPEKNLVVIHLSMHGAVDEENQPCLLPPGASPTDSKTWLRVADLLDYLFVDERPDRPTDSIKKLLILDCNRMDVNWGMGLLYNDFAARLRDVVDLAHVPNLVVLNSTSPGEIGWVAPELGGSIFSLLLCQGLRGAADVEAPGDDDGRVSLQELHQYLTAHVRQLVGATRLDVEVHGPMLWPTDADFPIVFAKSDEGTQLPPLAETDPRWREVNELWNRHAGLNRLGDDGPRRFHPVAWAEFEGKLLRLEQLVQAGEAYRDEFSETRKRLDSLAEKLARPPLGEDLAAYSLPLARELLLQPTSDERRAAADHLAAALQAKPATTEPKAESADPAAPKVDGPTPSGPRQEPSKTPADDKKPDDKKPDDKKAEDKKAEDKKADAKKSEEDKPAEPPETKRPDSYLASAAAAWDWCLAHPISDPDGRRRVLEFLAASEPRPANDVVEMFFVRMLDAYLDAPAWRDDPALVTRALAARALAEEAAAPRDERAYYWARASFAEDAPDQQRREAEDRLFISSAQREEIAKLLDAVIGPDSKSGYGKAKKLADEVAEAFALRDRIWSEVPYFARWQLARLSRDDHVADLREIIADSHRLGAMLDEAAARGKWTPEAGELVAAMKQKLAALEEAFDAQRRDLEVAADDAQTLRAITDMLAVPLVTGNQRRDLRDKYLRILAKTTSAGAEFRVEATGGPSAGDTAADQHLARLRPWEEHPALVILGGGKPREATKPPASSPASEPAAKREERTPGAEEQHLAEQGGQVRRLLAGVALEIEARLKYTKDKLASSDGSPASAAAIRGGRSQADRLARAAAPLLGATASDVLAVDPAQTLRTLDLHYLLLWQAERTVDDFWGPAPGQTVSYFQQVAQAYLASAERLCPEDTASLEKTARVPQLLASRVRAAEAGLRPVNVKDVWVDRDTRAARHQLAVDVPGDLPPGSAALFVAEADNLVGLRAGEKSPEADLRRMGVAVAAAGSAAPTNGEYWIPIGDASVTKTLDAVSLYRGHVRRTPFRIQPAAGTVTEWTRPDYPPPTVVVYGKARQQTSVVFILDCSGSMGEEAAREGNKVLTRLDVARASLETILDRLQRAKQAYHVGVYAYGHRVGWKREDDKQMVIRDPNNPSVFIPPPPNNAIHPSEDVEQLLRLGGFTRAEYVFTKGKLDALRHLGETPLYLAITDAIGELAKADPANPRHVVAITDGVNYQSDGPDDKRKIRDDVEEELKRPANKDVQLDIIGFALDPNKPEDVAAQKEFTDVAQKTEGRFYPARDPSSLLDALEQSLGLSQYVVKPEAGGREEGPLDLNATCTLPNPGDREVRYEVALTDEKNPAESRIAVEGAEAIELYLEDGSGPGGRRLVHHRYKPDEWRDECDKVPARWGGQNHELYVGAYLPSWKGDTARFYLSVQNADATKFSPRPVETWIRVTPISGDHPGTPYTFYDATFYNREYHPGLYSVPVLCCLAADWPKEAKDARLELACKFEKTIPDKVVAVGAFRQQPPTLPDLPDVSFDIETQRGETSNEPYRVTVTEHHGGDGALEGLKIAMSPTPDRIQRRFVPATRTARHTFFYPDSAGAKIDEYRVEITTRKRLAQGGSELPRPLAVRLSRD